MSEQDHELARLKGEIERLRAGWRQAEQDKNTHFAQSCKNLKRAEQAEARLREVGEIVKDVQRQSHDINGVMWSACDEIMRRLAAAQPEEEKP